MCTTSDIGMLLFPSRIRAQIPGEVASGWFTPGGEIVNGNQLTGKWATSPNPLGVQQRMWNPRNFEDTDYGLSGEESFEPADDQIDDFQPTDPYIMTVLGPIAPDQLGICQHHEHILCDPNAITEAEPAYRLDRIDLACEELESFVTVGGRSMVDASPADYGRDLIGLRTIARRVPVNIIAVTGRHKHLHASRMDNAFDQSAIEQEMLSDINSAIKPGIIKFGSSHEEITPVELIAAQAAASVAVAAGYPVTTHTEAGTMAHEQIDLVEQHGLAPNRLILGHMDRRLEFDYLTSLARRGAWLSFDQIGKRRFGDDAPKAEMLMRLAEAGFADQLLVSQDLARTSDLVAYGGGPGWIHLLERFTLEIMAAGGTGDFVRKILIDNPAVALSIHSPQ